MQPLIDLVTEATVKAAVRLIRTRLRQHLVAKTRAVVPRSKEKDAASKVILDIETAREASAEASWVTVLGLWRDSMHDETRRRLRGLVSDALFVALKESAYFIRATWKSYPYEDVKAWVEEYLDDFDEDTLVSWVDTDRPEFSAGVHDRRLAGSP